MRVCEKEICWNYFSFFLLMDLSVYLDLYWRKLGVCLVFYFFFVSFPKKKDYFFCYINLFNLILQTEQQNEVLDKLTNQRLEDILNAFTRIRKLQQKKINKKDIKTALSF